MVTLLILVGAPVEAEQGPEPTLVAIPPFFALAPVGNTSVAFAAFDVDRLEG